MRREDDVRVNHPNRLDQEQLILTGTLFSGSSYKASHNSSTNSDGKWEVATNSRQTESRIGRVDNDRSALAHAGGEDSGQ